MLGKNAARAAPIFAFADRQTVLGGDDIGPLLEEIRRQAHGQVGQDRVVVQVRSLRKPRRLRSDEQRERVRLRGARLFELRAERLRLREQSFDLRHVEARRSADLEAAREDAERLLAGPDGLAGDQDAFVQLAQREIAVGHLRDEAHGDRAPAGVGGEELLQRGILEVAHAAPEIELPRSDAQADVVDAGGARTARGAQALGNAHAKRSGVRVEGGKLIGPPDLERGARLENAQDRDAEIAVVLERLLDHRLQLRVGEVIAPGDVRGRSRIGLRVRRLERIGRVSSLTGSAGRLYSGANEHPAARTPRPAAHTRASDRSARPRRSDRLAVSEAAGRAAASANTNNAINLT